MLPNSKKPLLIMKQCTMTDGMPINNSAFQIFATNMPKQSEYLHGNPSTPGTPHHLSIHKEHLKQHAMKVQSIGNLTMNEIDAISKAKDSSGNSATQNQNSKKMSNVISESMLDCRDIGTSPICELDQIMGQSNTVLMGGFEKNGLDKPGEYAPIQQNNVDLLNQIDRPFMQA